MKSKYRDWSDPDIYVQTHNETNSAKTKSTEKKFFFHISHFNVLISRKTANEYIYPVYFMFIKYWLLNSSFRVILRTRIPATSIQKTKIITIPLAICQASENSCLVEKFSSTSQGSSSDSSRFSVESGIAEAWFFPSDADGLVRSSLSVTLNSSS